MTEDIHEFLTDAPEMSGAGVGGTVLHHNASQPNPYVECLLCFLTDKEKTGLLNVS